YCVSCDWSQLVTWYKPVVNSLVPCDLCDHSQISHVVSNEVRSDILLTTLHVITDWPIKGQLLLATSPVDHWVPAGDSLPPPCDRRVSPTRERPVYKQYRSLRCHLMHTAL
ncbi:unnamed protein product, partial [Staurois parvus]